MLDTLPISRKQALSVGNASALAPSINLWHGAVRSGKTIGSLFAFLMAVATAPSQGEIVVIGRTRDTIYRNLFAPLQDPALFGPMTEHVRYNRGAPTAEILGRTVHVIGASDVRAENAIRGMTVCLAYVDEVTLVAEEFFAQLIARMSVEGAKLYGTTNPDGPRHWLKVQYLDRAEELGHRIFHFRLRDNEAHLPGGYIDGLEAQYTGVWRQRFVEGLWTLADGVIYDAFDPETHVVDELPPMLRVLSLGVDYGTTNPTRGILLGLGADHRLYAMGEWAPEQATDAGLSKGLQEWQSRQPPPEYLFVDPAAASFKLQLHHDGVGRVFNAANQVVDGIRVVASLFSTRQLLVHASCTNLLDELPGYVWDAAASAKGEDKPIKLNDHAADALRYAVASSRPMWQPYLREPLRETATQPDLRLEAAS